VRVHTSTKKAHQCLCWSFSQKFFIWWWNRPKHTTSDTWLEKLDLATDYPTLRCQTWWLSLPWLCRWDTQWKTRYMTTDQDSRQLHILFYGKTMTRDIFLYILRFLHFSDNSQTLDEEGYDWLWQLRTVSDTLNAAYAKFHNHSQHLAVGKVIVKFKYRVIFRQYITKKKNISATKFMNSVMNQGTHVTQVCTWVETHTLPLTTSLQHTWLADLRAKNTTYLWTICFHPQDFLMTWKDVKYIHAGQYSHTENIFPVTLDYKITKLKRGDVMVTIRGGLTTLIWKDRSEVYVPSNTDPQPAEGNFGDKVTTPENSYCGTEQPKRWQFW